ncbi:effector-associated constant component EACC1 [Phaeacidiphilus oryzae]|jgi:hypothetical protein|uniref:effector-associated constant component EACC1 n=1 Tax=Phaeacidiphilus oryzae TaxID=348818 RepID=UPI00055E17C1|nr:hypothetical protein [Phaeacidiphilus oryzae]
MQVLVRLKGDHPEGELRSLHNWLRDDRETRRTATISLVEKPLEPGAMGGELDAIKLVTENVWSAAAFLMTVVTWRRTRPKPAQITIRRGDLEVTLEKGTDDEIERVIAALGSSSDLRRESDE